MGKKTAAAHIRQRRELLELCNGLAKIPLSFDSGSFVEDPQARRRFGRSLYTDLGKFAYDQFIDGLKPQVRGRLKHPGIEDGFRVMALLLGASPEPYRQFRSAKNMPVTIPGLQAALRRSSDVPAAFMELRGGVNHLMELRYGLNRNSGEADVDKFRFEDRDEGEVFALDPEQFKAHLADVSRSPVPDPSSWKHLPDSLRQCTGFGFVIQQAWPAMIDLAGEVPAAFAHDLGIKETEPNLH